MGILDVIFVRGKHVCPWWLCRSFDNPLRRLFQDPERILRPHVKPGFTVIDVGPGMGYFTIPLLRLVGSGGKVVALDIQRRMLEALRQRADRTGVSGNLVTHLGKPGDPDMPDSADFVLIFWMIHEVPDQRAFLADLKACLRPGGRMLIVEPRLHVSTAKFRSTLDAAERVGLTLVARPEISLSQAALFLKD
ncbi:MAG: methyltransferase type 11 [Deltaproteobacteria bacterium HGW-Deltaproteobacteria-19]|jgi:ubiquinone/menaquinone biosynthesis C-methylase UbiE|nr:MAG: methyltransferase type 11 [Deltaproteobacteria bacterium HGW-Deltaproteobacteria-19]